MDTLELQEWVAKQRQYAANILLCCSIIRSTNSEKNIAIEKIKNASHEILDQLEVLEK
jgi:hypothetical protein